MASTTSLFLESGGPLGLTRDFFFLILASVIIPTITATFIHLKERQRWKPLRSHLGIMISYHHGVLEDKVRKIEDSPKQRRNGTNPLVDQLIQLQTEIGSFGFCLDSAGAKKVGEYWKQINYLWFWVEFRYEGHPDYEERIRSLIARHKLENPFRRSKLDIVTDINRAYDDLMKALGTEWYYQWPWDPMPPRPTTLSKP